VTFINRAPFPASKALNNLLISSVQPRNYPDVVSAASQPGTLICYPDRVGWCFQESLLSGLIKLHDSGAYLRSIVDIGFKTP
jgi:hypothetical protein